MNGKMGFVIILSAILLAMFQVILLETGNVQFASAMIIVEAIGIATAYEFGFNKNRN